MRDTRDLDDLTTPEMREALMRRAMAAWYASGSTEHPTPKRSAVEVIEGLTYVSLRAGVRLLALYRVRLVGGKAMLKRLKRLPEGVEGAGTDV